LNSATASLFTSASLALVTASVNNDDITFTKGDGSQFTIQVATGSFAVSASYAETASFALNGGVTQILAGPNITVSPLSGQGQVTISSTGTGSGGFNTTTGSYGSFYDTTTQINPVANAANSMSFNETAITNGVSISGSTNPFNTYIKTENAGVYNLQFSAQLDKTDSGTDSIDIWIRKNGIDLLDTGTTVTLTGNNDKSVAAWNWFVQSAANDYYQIIWSSADTDMRLLAEVSSIVHPGIPSVIATVNRVDQFLSNTGSFSGSFTGTFNGYNLTEFTTTSSFNSYTSSTDSRLNNIEAATSSYVTSAITASSLVTASVSLNTITFTKGDASTFNITVDTGSATGGAISVQDEGSILGNATSFNFNGAGVTATLSAGTASITIPGGASINTGSFATTGSNVFTGDQTLIDAAGNFFTITDTSGSMMLVAKSYTSASAHLSSSVPSPSGSQLNLIFKNNNNTADTIISGSNNIFTNPTAPTAGFKRYIGGSGNLMLSPGAINQISASQAFPITTNFNIHTAGAITTRAAASASAWNINQNMLIGSIIIGNSAANNAEKILGSLTINNNQVGNNLSIIANRTAISASAGITNNAILGGATTLTMASSSIGYQTNVGNANITNGFQNAGATTGNNSLQVVSNWFHGAYINVSGSDAGGVANPRYIGGNYLFNGYNLTNAPIANLSLNGSGSSMLSTMVMGHELGVTGSNGYDSNRIILTPGIGAGSAFFGRWNAQDGNRARTAETVFAIGTGTATGQRKTGFLIDSGSNTFIEGTLTVSGSTRITGSLTMSGSILFVDRSGNDTNTYLGLNALGMGNAGAQPLAVGNSIAVAIGIGAMRFASGSNQNVAIGNNALLNTSGSKNFAMGSEALSSNTTGASNIGIGTSALQNNTTGDSSTAIGDSAAQFASGSQNTFIGQYAGYNVTGSNNVIIGSYRGVAGEKISNNIILSDGQQNIRAQYSGSAWSFQDNIKLNKGTNKTTDIVSVNGSATVNNSLVTAASIILVTTQNSGTGPVYPAVVLNKGTGTFDIAHNFGSALDVAYMIINPT
jgi:hypothetical protein